MNIAEAEALIDRWGANPDEWFVVGVETEPSVVQKLSKSPVGKAQVLCAPAVLQRPDGSTLPWYGVGSLVRKVALP